MCLQYSASPAATPYAQMARTSTTLQTLRCLAQHTHTRQRHTQCSPPSAPSSSPRTQTPGSTRPKRSLSKIILPRDDAGGGFRLWRRQSKQARTVEPTRCDLEGGDIPRLHPQQGHAPLQTHADPVQSGCRNRGLWALRQHTARVLVHPYNEQLHHRGVGTDVPLTWERAKQEWCSGMHGPQNKTQQLCTHSTNPEQEPKLSDS
ncbi:hypothetical protein K438DRAFT_1989946 [Mycena galopus ATCC 62051]|nr:hypothetical protein K438DRAFT_1989946 [Mycena galopus ATCC 62051]